MLKPKLKKFPFEEFKSIYSRVPRLCVEVVIKTKDGIVLTKRDIPPAKGQWHIPGGTVLMGERLEDAVKRLAEEELGVKVEIERLLGVIEYSFKNYFSQPIGIAYLTKITSGQLSSGRNTKALGQFKIIPKNTIKAQKDLLCAKLRLSQES